MPMLLADRFMPVGAAWVDLATGATVRLRISPARSGSDRLVWNDWCAALASRRHPLLNVLVDWGYVDAGRTFEAYEMAGAVEAGGMAGPRLLMHAARFLESAGVHLDAEAAALVLRSVVPGRGRLRRPLGIVLQARRVLRLLEEALDEVAPGGAVLLAVNGIRGSGLRTTCVQAAQLARMHGYVPVSARVFLGAPWVADVLRTRHVCVLLSDNARATAAAAAALSARLGMASARRHAIIKFGRSPEEGGIVLEPLGVTAMLSMVFTDRDFGPDEEELLDAVRRADGLPGRLLAELRATPLTRPDAAFEVVHETSPAYVVGRPPEAAPQRPQARSLASAGERAARLARRGRHASAIRLLTRAARVLERRGDRDRAAACAEQLGWILRARGRTPPALEQFARAAGLAGGTPGEVSATIATGVVWTDECRFPEAEAALRSALAAAELLQDRQLQGCARLALGRALYWQGRHDEATLALAPAFTLLRGAPVARAHSLAARIACARGDLAQALQSANTALACVDADDPATRAAVMRAMVEVRLALGDRDAARACLREGLQAARSTHAPLAAMRLRALAARLGPGGSREFRSRVPTHGTNGNAVPPLLRRQLASEPDNAADATPMRRESPPAIPALERFLETTFSAPDDRAGIEAICRDLCERLKAATVQVLVDETPRRVIARAGRPWSGDLRMAERVLAGGTGPVFGDAQPREAAQPVCVADQTIAVLVCRWTMTAVFDPAEAAGILRSAALAIAPAVRTLRDRAAPAPPDLPWRDLIGTSPGALALREAIMRAARAPFPVLIEGESGSGKELVARAIHRFSARRDRKLCTINCAAISDDLLEAELFGHSRGAFTGAVGDRPGLFEEADGGTLFLDEVGELSPRAQAKLLRVLQDGEVRRVGENLPRRVDARVIAATNRRLEQEVELGRFRADLRFRLDVVRIQVPPLRDRPMDVPLLATHFWEEAARRVESRAVLAPETLHALARYDWPGNIRQLQNVIATLAVQAPRRGRVPPSLLPAPVARTAAEGATTFEAARTEFERRYVAAELARAGGHRTRAARALGVTRQGLAKMLRRLNLEE